MKILKKIFFKKRSIKIMNRIIFCTFFKKKSEGQDFQSYPGKLGKKNI
ncbi:hypothetical protein CWQ_02940 [Buchnera aphidicola str. TLW03 (Acyrthosiphon pisum)]|nr:hypothetical protein CWQ_02940 [Buchnera aphidicola str. TLW03 (Acyrthosiphon pisum)]